MTRAPGSYTILLADDDEDDRLLTRDAMEECGFETELRVVEDGEELLDYLRGDGKYSGVDARPRPNLILLDLNMPRKDGRQALTELKSDPQLRAIPVVVFTTSSSPEDIAQSYDRGASSYLTKPTTFAALVEMMANVKRYWLSTASVPQGPGAH